MYTSICDIYVLEYLKCMKRNDTSHNKCKVEFDIWYNCFNLIKY